MEGIASLEDLSINEISNTNLELSNSSDYNLLILCAACCQSLEIIDGNIAGDPFDKELF